MKLLRWLLPLFIVGVCALPADAGITLVQQKSVICTASPCTLTLTSTPALNDVIIAWGMSQSGSITRPTNFTDLDNVASSDFDQAYCVVTGSVCNTTTVVSFTFGLCSTALQQCAVYAQEFSGELVAAPIDKHNGQLDGTDFITASLTPTQANDAVTAIASGLHSTGSTCGTWSASDNLSNSYTVNAVSWTGASKCANQGIVTPVILSSASAVQITFTNATLDSPNGNGIILIAPATPPPSAPLPWEF